MAKVLAETLRVSTLNEDNDRVERTVYMPGTPLSKIKKEHLEGANVRTAEEKRFDSQRSVVLPLTEEMLEDSEPEPGDEDPAQREATQNATEEAERVKAQQQEKQQQEGNK